MLQHPIGNGKLTARIPREVAALIDALQLRGANTDALLELSDHEWLELLDFCDAARLTLFLAQVEQKGFPSFVIDRLKKNVADNAARFARAKSAYAEIANALKTAGIEHIVLKGFTQAPDYVRSSRGRAQGDIDLFCPPKMLEHAQKVLQSLGYEPQLSEDYRYADHVPSMVRPGNWEWRGNVFDPDLPIPVELHFCLWNERVSNISIEEVNGFWERRVTRTLEGMSFPSLSPADHLAYFSLHILRDLLGGDWIIHHVHELASLLHHRADDHEFWKVWKETYSNRVRSLQAIAFFLAQAWFSCDLHSDVEAEIQSLPSAIQQWLQRFAASSLEGMFRQNKDRIWLHIALLDSQKEKRKLLWRRLIPRKIPAANHPAVKIENNRLSWFAGLHPLPRYIFYLLSRMQTHARMIPITLLHGFSWWMSQRQLGTQFWIFLAASFFFDLGLSIYFFLFNIFLTGHGYTEKTLGLLISTMAAGNLVGAIPSGAFLQKVGVRRSLLACLFLVVPLFIARTFLLDLPSQLVLAFLAGICLSLWVVCFAPAVAQTAPDHLRPFAFSLICSEGIGVVALGGLAGGRLPGWFAAMSSRPHFIQPEQMCLLFSCCIVAFGIWPASKLAIQPLHNVSKRARPVLSPFLLRFLPLVAIWGLVTGAFSPLANVYFAQHLHMPLAHVGTIFSASQIMQVVAVLISPLLFRRWGLTAGIAFTQVMTAILFSMLAITNNPLMAGSIYVGITAFQWMNEPGLFSLLMSKVPDEQRAGASASNSLVMSVSQLVSASLAGSAIVRYGYSFLLSSVSVIALAAGILFWKTLSARSQALLQNLDEQPL